MVAASLSGLVAIFTSAMIYVDTRRWFWSPQLAFVKFYGTMFLLGGAGTATFGAWLGANPVAQTMGLAALLVQAALLFGRSQAITATCGIVTVLITNLR